MLSEPSRATASDTQEVTVGQGVAGSNPAVLAGSRVFSNISTTYESQQKSRLLMKSLLVRQHPFGVWPAAKRGDAAGSTGRSRLPIMRWMCIRSGSRPRRSYQPFRRGIRCGRRMMTPGSEKSVSSILCCEGCPLSLSRERRLGVGMGVIKRPGFLSGADSACPLPGSRCVHGGHAGRCW